MVYIPTAVGQGGNQGYPPLREPVVDPRTGIITRPWGLFNQQISQSITQVVEGANLRYGTQAQRLALNPGTLLNGTVFYETDTSDLYMAIDARWVYLAINRLRASDARFLINVFNGLNFRSGPWRFGGEPGARPAVIRPPEITGDVDDYAPDDVDSAIWIEITSSGAVSISGLESQGINAPILDASLSHTRDRRLVFFYNRGSYTITLLNESVSSRTSNRFVFQDGRDFPLYKNSIIGLYQDTGGTQQWILWAALNNVVGETPYVPSFFHRDSYAVRPDGVGTTHVGVGCTNPTIIGSPAADNQSTGLANSYTTGAGAGSAAGFRLHGTDANVQTRYAPTWKVVVRTGATLAGVRLWIGLTQTAPLNLDDLGGTSQYIMFRYSTVAADPGWVGVSRQYIAPGPGTSSVTPLIAPIAVNTDYELKIRVVSASSVFFSVNGGTEVALATDLPSANPSLGYALIIFTTAGGARAFTAGIVSCEQTAFAVAA